MTVKEYIKSKNEFELMPFVTVYKTIMQLINDGYVAPRLFELGGIEYVENAQPKPQRQICWGLYSSGDHESNR